MPPKYPARRSTPTAAGEALEAVGETDQERCLLRQDGMWRSVTRRALEESPPDEPSQNLERELAPALYPDLPVDAALRLPGSHPLLAVANRSRPDELGRHRNLGRHTP